ncbi:RDD family protein [Streptomyces sp. NPDC050549]|uniref:RDD family protein n=1 Tax=Streptomyces sp. NPDC050549 TaxID=3155406 RepID=UPI0034242DD8
MSAPTPAPGDDRPREGYYPDPSIPGYVRYWNGSAWVPGTSRPAPSDGLSPAAPGAGPSVEETGPHFFDEDPAPAHPEPASAWGADRAHQSGFGGAQDRHVSWGAPDPRVPADTPDEGTTTFRRQTPRTPQQGGAPGARSGGTGNAGGAGAGAFGAAGDDGARGSAGTGSAAAGYGPQGSPEAGPGAGGFDAQGPRGSGSGAGGFGAQGSGGSDSAAGGYRSQSSSGSAAGGYGPAGTGSAGGDHGARGSAAAGGLGGAGAPSATDGRRPGGNPPAAGGQGPGGNSPAGDPSGPGFGAGKAAAARAAAAQAQAGRAGAGTGAPAAAPASASTALSGPPQPAPGVPSQSGPVQQPQAAAAMPMATGSGGGQPSWAQQVHRLAGDEDGPVAPWKPPVEDVFQAAARRQSAARPAGLGKRLLARLVDTVVLGAVTAVAAVPLGTRAADHINEKIDAAKLSGRAETVWLLDGTTAAYLGIVLAVLLLFGVLYEALPTAKWGRTLGKKLCGLEVRGIESHEPPGFGGALRRWLVYSVPGVLGIGIVGVAWCLFDRPWHQCWHDKAAHTFVAG